MAQTLANSKSALARVCSYFRNNAVPLTNAGLTTILTIPCFGMWRLWARLNVTTRALTAFQVQGKFHAEDSVWSVLASATLDFTTPRGIVYGASGDLTVLATGATGGWLGLDVTGIEQIRLQATCATDATGTLDLYGGASS